MARVLMYGGIAVVALGLSLVHSQVIADPPYSYTGTFRFAWALAYIAVLAVTAYGLGLPDLTRNNRSAAGIAVMSVVIAAMGVSAIQLLVGDALLPRFVVFGTALLLVPWYVLCASLARGGEASEEERARVLAVVDAEEEEVLRRDLQRRPEHASHLVAVLRPEEAESAHTGRPRLVDEVREHQASVVIFNRAAQASEDIVAQAASAHESGVRVRTLSLFYEQWLGKLPLHDLERVGLMFDIGEVHRARYGRAKRALDLALGVVGVLVLVVVVPFVFLANLVGNRGPLFYRQLRVGKNGTEFEILKFRTMRPSASQLVDEWTVEDDDRITPVGRVLRKAHLDELPQMINIVRGELAVVGPRPEQVGYVVELTEKIPFYDLRHLVRPGLTGWAQVKYGYAADEADAIEKLQYDFYYLRHQSVSLDLRIIGRTLRSVLQREGR